MANSVLLTPRGSSESAEASPPLAWPIGTALGNESISFGVILRHSGVVTASLVERMAPDSLWELFERVVPPAPERPQGGGRRRCGDRGVLAAIIFVATSGCTRNQLPPGFGLSGGDRVPPVLRVIRGQGVGQAPPPGP